MDGRTDRWYGSCTYSWLPVGCFSSDPAQCTCLEYIQASSRYFDSEITISLQSEDLGQAYGNVVIIDIKLVKKVSEHKFVVYLHFFIITTNKYLNQMLLTLTEKVTRNS
jgi:hypothetical protein